MIQKDVGVLMDHKLNMSFTGKKNQLDLSLQMLSK